MIMRIKLLYRRRGLSYNRQQTIAVFMRNGTQEALIIGTFWEIIGIRSSKPTGDGDDIATVAEFGKQLLVLVDADGAEVLPFHLPTFRVAEGTTQGATVGTLSVVNAETGTAATISLVGMSDEFEVSGSDINVKTAASFDYQTEHRYILTLEFTEGGITLRRDLVIEVINPLDEDGDGLIDITTLAQLNVMRFDLNGDGRADDSSDEDAYEKAFDLESDEVACASGCEGYELMADIDFEDANTDGTVGDLSVWAEGAVAAGVDKAVPEGWEPIGSDTKPYAATFEGNSHTISNLFINRSSDSGVGLFGYVDGGAIRNLGLEDGIVIGGGNTSALAGVATSTTITSCYAMVSANGLFPVGGLVANATDVTLTSCYSTGAVGGTLFVGGLIATASGSTTLTSCYATGDVVGSGDRVGGLIATAVSTVTITSCYAMGNVTGGGDIVGGLVGDGDGPISLSYAMGAVEGRSNVGGLVGEAAGSVTGCYAMGAVDGRSNVGGLVGEATGSITSAYATGDVDGPSNVGGLVGNLGPSGAIMASYYDNSSASRGIGNLGIGGPAQSAVSKTTSELQMPTAYDDNMDDTDGSSIYEAWNIEWRGAVGLFR